MSPSSSSRILQLARILESRRALSIPELAKEVGTSVRTAYRYLAAAEEAGVPVVREETNHRVRWRMMEGSRRQLNLTLSPSELFALIAGNKLLGGLEGTQFHQSSASALDKIRAVLPSAWVKRTEEAALNLSARAGHVHRYDEQRKVLLRVVEAVESSRRLELGYRKTSHAKVRTRRFDPYNLHVQGSTLYLLGYCNERKALRTLLLDRIVFARMLNEVFERQAEVRPAEWLQGSFGPFEGKPHFVQLVFYGKASSYMSERKVHPSQQAQWRGDDALEVSLRLPISPGLKSWLVGFADGVEILTPRRLRVAVCQAHQRALRRADADL